MLIEYQFGQFLFFEHTKCETERYRTGNYLSDFTDIEDSVVIRFLQCE